MASSDVLAEDAAASCAVAVYIWSGDAVLLGNKHHGRRISRNAVGTEHSDVIAMQGYAGSLLVAFTPEFIIRIMNGSVLLVVLRMDLDHMLLRPKKRIVK